MKIGIIGAMQQEVAILKDLIEDVQEVNQAGLYFLQRSNPRCRRRFTAIRHW